MSRQARCTSISRDVRLADQAVIRQVFRQPTAAGAVWRLHRKLHQARSEKRRFRQRSWTPCWKQATFTGLLTAISPNGPFPLLAKARTSLGGSSRPERAWPSGDGRLWGSGWTCLLLFPRFKLCRRFNHHFFRGFNTEYYNFLPIPPLPPFLIRFPLIILFTS